MKKRHSLATRAFGAEPVRPDIAVLAEWITANRGTAADIINEQPTWRALATAASTGIPSLKAP